MLIPLAIVILVSLLIDFINVYGLKRMMRRLKGSGIFTIFIRGYWAITIGFFLFVIAGIFYIGQPGYDFVKFRNYYMLFGIFVLVYLPRIDFLFFVIWQLLYYKIKLIIRPRAEYIVRRNKRRSYLIQKIGLGFTFLSFMFILYGMIWGTTDFVVRQNTIHFKDLPKGFDGFRIAQISDMHLGSFANVEDVRKGLDLLQQQDVDVVLFTGDMVNVISDEMDEYIADFKSIQPPYGKYAILGNHDMGDYLKWETPQDKKNELKRIAAKEKRMGFDLLINKSNIIYRKGDSIALLGIENWGNPPFKQYGDLNAALRNVRNMPFKILLSHDPNHFVMQVKDKTDIQLTLSGHTHGMQMGINCCGIKWSPISFMYEHWNGLYEFDQQYLYVNPGFGFLGLPARIGIRPEITIITLKRKK